MLKPWIQAQPRLVEVAHRLGIAMALRRGRESWLAAARRVSSSTRSCSSAIDVPSCTCRSRCNWRDTYTTCAFHGT